MYHLEAPTLDNFDYYDILKTFSIQADFWMKVHPFLPENHIVIMDLKYITLRIIPKVNIFYLQKFLVFLLVSDECLVIKFCKIYLIDKYVLFCVI